MNFSTIHHQHKFQTKRSTSTTERPVIAEVAMSSIQIRNRKPSRDTVIDNDGGAKNIKSHRTACHEISSSSSSLSSFSSLEPKLNIQLAKTSVFSISKLFVMQFQNLLATIAALRRDPISCHRCSSQFGTSSKLARPDTRSALQAPGLQRLWSFRRLAPQMGAMPQLEW
jgi:hypothetical protein